MRNMAGMRQNFTVVQGQKSMQFGDPVFHIHRNTLHGLSFGENKILFYQIIECKQLFFRQIILRNRHILFPDFNAAPRGQPHIGFVAVAAFRNYLRRRFPRYGPVHFILHGFEKLNTHIRRGVIVRTRRIYFDNFLIKPLF